MAPPVGLLGRRTARSRAVCRRRLPRGLPLRSRDAEPAARIPPWILAEHGSRRHGRHRRVHDPHHDRAGRLSGARADGAGASARRGPTDSQRQASRRDLLAGSRGEGATRGPLGGSGRFADGLHAARAHPDLLPSRRGHAASRSVDHARPPARRLGARLRPGRRREASRHAPSRQAAPQRIPADRGESLGVRARWPSSKRPSASLPAPSG